MHTCIPTCNCYTGRYAYTTADLKTQHNTTQRRSAKTACSASVQGSYIRSDFLKASGDSVFIEPGPDSTAGDLGQLAHLKIDELPLIVNVSRQTGATTQDATHW